MVKEPLADSVPTATAEAELDAKIQAVIEGHDRERASLIPLLQDIQSALGYIPPEAIAATARFLGLTDSTVYGVTTFYSQFYLTRQGRHKVKVCQGTACHVRGAPEIVKAVAGKLGIGPGQTTDGFEFTVESVACFGSCALAPVMVVNDKVYGNVTPQRAVQILEGLS